MKTGWASVKLALAGFILPYMFVYNTELLLLDTPIAKGIQVAITAAIGVFPDQCGSRGIPVSKGQCRLAYSLFCRRLSVN